MLDQEGWEHCSRKWREYQGLRGTDQTWSRLFIKERKGSPSSSKSGGKKEWGDLEGSVRESGRIPRRKKKSAMGTSLGSNPPLRSGIFFLLWFIFLSFFSLFFSLSFPFFSFL